MKNKNLIFAVLSAIAITSLSCSKNFESINKSPDQVIEPTLDYLLPHIQLTLSDNAYYTNVTIIGQIMYQVNNYGTNFSALTIGTNKDYHFENQYTRSIKNLTDFVDKTKDSEELINYNSVGRILKAYAFQTITDLYGDVPYFQAGKGFIDRDFQPEYDSQQAIYEDMLKELKESAESFDNNLPLSSKADLIYKGDLGKWKKLAYSLMLRMALRINNADPAGSAQWISTAINGGVFESNSDNFTVLYKPNTYYATISNGQPTPFIYYTSWKLAAAFVDTLKNNLDPRIYIYSALPNGDTAMASQFGLPSFQPTNELPKALVDYSVSPASTFGSYAAPFIHQSYAEVQYMLAEIAMRELVTELKKEDASALYESGLRAAFDQLKIYGGSYSIPEAAVENYIERNKLNTSSLPEALNRINTEYWINTHYNFYETYANWRRSGFPRFDESVNVIPRRMTYPVNEWNINKESIQKAIDRQGTDLVTTKVWWDK